MRRTYWSCTKFADWLRGTSKPHAETSKGWRLWKQEAKAAHPFRYWLADDGLDYLQNFVMWPIDKIYAVKYYINNRWVTRTHALTAHPRDIPRGQWTDVGNRFLPCLFNELVEFVEVELAWWHLVWEGREERAKYNMPWWAVGWFRWRTWRCRQAGLDNLEWQRNLKCDGDWYDKEDPRYGQPTAQAVSAQEIYDLYMWWTEVYPKRPDPHEASGWTAFCAERRKITGDDIFLDLEDADEEYHNNSKKILDRCREIEEAYEKEDEEMLIRLIKIRKSLWT